MPELLRIAIIGAGQIARTTHIPNLSGMEGVDIVGVSDVRVEAAKALAEECGLPEYFGDHREMLGRLHPDGVIVCVPNRFHCSITLDALHAGCHVLCEKPPAMSGEEAGRMEAAAREKNLVLTYGFHFRHSSQVAFLKRKIEEGVFGDIYYSRVQWLRRRGIPGWGNFTNRAMQGGGALIDIGAHMLDAAMYLLDYPEIDSVYAISSDRIGTQGGCGSLGDWKGDSFSVEDGLFAMIRFRNGTGMNLETAFALHQKEQNVRNVSLFGSRMGASLFPTELYGTDGERIVNLSFPEMPERDWHADCDRDFVLACRGEKAPLVTAAQGTYIQQVLEALYRSAGEGIPVRLP